MQRRNFLEPPRKQKKLGRETEILEIKGGLSVWRKFIRTFGLTLRSPERKKVRKPQC